MKKVFRSVNEIRQHYLPKQYAKEQREERIAEIGIMGMLLEDLKRNLEKYGLKGYVERIKT